MFACGELAAAPSASVHVAVAAQVLPEIVVAVVLAGEQHVADLVDALAHAAVVDVFETVRVAALVHAAVARVVAAVLDAFDLAHDPAVDALAARCQILDAHSVHRALDQTDDAADQYGYRVNGMDLRAADGSKFFHREGATTLRRGRQIFLADWSQRSEDGRD